MNETKIQIQNLYKLINQNYSNQIDFDKFTLKVDETSKSIYRSNEFHLLSQSSIFHQIDEEYRPSYVIDVGANVGFSSLLFAKTFSKIKKIFSIEPNINLISLIKENFVKNNIQNFELINNVIGNKDRDSVEFQINTILSVDSRVKGLENEYEFTKSYVKEITLDTFILEKNIPKDQSIFIKIDTQGSEEYVIQGCKNTLADFNKYCVMMEFAPYWLERCDTDPVKFLKSLCSEYNICELPMTPSFYREHINEIKSKIITPNMAESFVNYTKHLSKAQKGWCDLMIFKE